jgi:hypothetical protein
VDCNEDRAAEVPGGLVHHEDNLPKSIMEGNSGRLKSIADSLEVCEKQVE